MTYQDLRREHPGKVCICQSHLRDIKSGRVLSWVCLGTVDTVEAAGVALKRLDMEGVVDSVTIPTSGQALEGNLAVILIPDKKGEIVQSVV